MCQQPQILLDRFLVCGLGSLGQHCVVALKGFGVNAIAIDKIPPQDWDIPDLPELLNELLIGDCRQSRVLERAKIQQHHAQRLAGKGLKWSLLADHWSRIEDEKPTVHH